jgi:hypothetical protein
MTEPITYPAPVLELPIPPQSKWAREHQAFLQMLPALLQTHRGKYVAIHEGQVVGSGDDKITLALHAYAQYGYVPIYVGLVAERPLPRPRIPHYRILSPG